MPAQLTTAEQQRVDQITRTQKRTGADAIRAINLVRARRGIDPIEQKAVYSYIRGETHTRSATERRGVSPTVTKGHIRTFMSARRRLIQEADGQYRVTWADIVEEAGLDLDCGQRTIENAIRASTGVRYRPARPKVAIKETDAVKRRAFVKLHLKKPATYWTKRPTKTKAGVNGYFDCKSWPLALTPDQKSHFNKTRTFGHLRLPSEGTDRGFTTPRMNHSFLGIPSINVAAVVSEDRIVLWKVVEGTWNGERAAETYEHIGKVFKKRFGERKSYTLVEDGDRKGNQSNKGKAAKKKHKIRSLTLSPRTPSLMPLDYSIWHAVLGKMADCEPAGREPRADFIKRLRRCAMSLSRTYIAKVVGRMKANLQAISDAKGYTPKND
jgi:hypothetical protein